MRKIVFYLIFGLMFSLSYAWASIAADRVLILHSFHSEFGWVQGINSTLVPQLEAAAVPYRIFYMDTKRKSDSAWKLKMAQKARQLINDYAPRVVIAVDDVAQAYVARNFAGDNDMQLVFAGVNADPEFYGYPAANVTGILERTYPEQVLKMLKMIIPSPLKTVWISDDSATANLELNRVRRKARNGSLPVAIAAFKQPVTFDQWKAAIRHYNVQDDIGAFLIPLYHTVKSRVDGRSLLPAKVMQWTVANTHKPVIGFWPFSADDGAICAVVVDPREHGKVAGLMVRRILAGKKAGDLPMVVNQDGLVIINIAVANRLGIEVPFEVMLSADKIIEQANEN